MLVINSDWDKVSERSTEVFGGGSAPLSSSAITSAQTTRCLSEDIGGTGVQGKRIFFSCHASLYSCYDDGLAGPRAREFCGSVLVSEDKAQPGALYVNFLPHSGGDYDGPLVGKDVK